jgi:hypothetical protein
MYEMNNASVLVLEKFNLIVNSLIYSKIDDRIVNDFKLQITHNSVYDEVIAIVN